MISQCRVAQGRMQEFTAYVQKWEQDALRDDDSPRWHGVYLSADDPHRVIVVNDFETRERAEAFSAKGHLQAFREAVLHCLVDEPDREGFDLYYAATPDGPTVTFGKNTLRAEATPD